MKKIKIISMVLTFVILVTSSNLGMMFTSNATDVSSIEGIRSAVAGAVDGATVEIRLTADIDGSAQGSVMPIDASGKIVKFDGGSHLISNLNLNGGGLFSNVGVGSSFTELGMYNCTITDQTSSAKSGYGFIVGTMPSGSITNCFATGTIAVYGNVSEIGGLVGSFSGSMSNCFAMTDIYSDGSYVGGLVGRLNEMNGSVTIGQTTISSSSVSSCYSTGSIDDNSRDHIGGLIAYSETSAVSDCYTSCCIIKPYANTVRAIGNIPDLASTVYYDKNLSLQRQGDLDTANRSTSAGIASKLTGTAWSNNTGYYPQLVAFAGKGNGYGQISALSAVTVDINIADDYSKGTGREFTIVSKSTTYTYAVLTNNRSTSNASLIDDWRITGGVDEYYYNSSDTTGFASNNGGALYGLSGNTYDVTTGKYLFVNTGDVKFTAYSGSYERDIYVHVTTQAKTPYILGGNGKTDPFIIDTAHELDMIRLFCIDETAGNYIYSINADISLTQEWHPILGMKGTLKGNGKSISGVSVKEGADGYAGFIANSSVKLTLSDLHISEASVDADARSSGILIGNAVNANISNVLATGSILGAEISGMLAGIADSTTVINKCSTFGMSESTETGAGIVGMSNGTSVSDCYSTAVVKGASTVSGLIGGGSGTITASLFTGMIEAAPGGVMNGIAGTGVTVNTGCYYDRQAAGIVVDTTGHAKTTAEIIDLNMGNSWVKSGGKYPQLTVFTADPFGSKTKAASAFSVIPVSYAGNGGNASSIAFDTATYNNKDYYGENDADSPSANGYTYSSPTFTRIGGGTEIVKLTHSGAFADVRYLLFDVKNLTIHYKFNYTDSSKQLYTEDMSGKGLAVFENQLGGCFNFILDSDVIEYTDTDTDTEHDDAVIVVAPATRALSFDIVNPFGYSATKINVYYMKGEALTRLDLDDKNSVSISGLDSIYVEYAVDEPEIPWGIYRIDCN